MSTTTHGQLRAGLILGIMAGLVALCVIGFMAVNVVRDLRLLETANSDNMQWTVSQGEVEYLAMLAEIETTRLSDGSDLSDLRKKFDIFYSRIAILQESLAGSILRDDPGYVATLLQAQAFLDRIVPLIDADDEVLRRSLAAISEDAKSLRLPMRNLANTSLLKFAQEAEQRRADVAITLTRLGLITIGLIIALMLSVLRLVRQNKQIDQRQKAVEQTVTRLNMIIDTSLDGVVVADETGRILEFNSAAEGIFGYTTAEVMGRVMVDILLTPEQRRKYLDNSRLTQIAEKPSIIGFGRVRFEAVRKNGEVFPVEVAVESAKTDDGEVFVTFLRDISVRVRAETELVKARDQALAGERMKTEFLATMSHEIRTPLNGLLGNLALLSATALTDRQARFVRDMEKSGRLLMQHVTDVLDITRYDAGNVSLKHGSVNLGRLLGDIIDSQSGTAAAHGTRIRWKWIGAPMNWVKSDPDRLLHILQNLIGNAVKFTHDGQITVTVEAGPLRDGRRETEFRIIDTGIGVAPELHATVFDDFVTGHTAYNRTVGGTGLGLSIVRRFASAMGGEVGLEDTKGQGATFWVRLPLQPTTRAQANAGKAEKAALPLPVWGLNVLVVEDNEINRMVLCEMLRASGHRTTVAHDGRAGVQLAHETRFDLILMDISMPIMDGRTATRAIRAGGGVSDNAPIVAITANAMAEERAACLKDGMNGILTKPLLPDDLDAVIRQFATNGADTQTQVVDHRHHLETRDALGEDAYRRLVDRFISEGEDLIGALSDDGAMSRDEIGKRCHRMAGSAAVFGAVEMQGNLRVIETGIKSGDGAVAATRLSEIERIWEDTKAALLS